MVINKVFNNLEEAVKYIYEEASKYASEGVENNIGGPFGAGIIEKSAEESYIVLNICRNEVINSKDPTSHAEMNAIREACEIKGEIFLENCFLVTTAKSCPMCLAASVWAQIPVIYYSEDYSNATQSGFKDENISEYIKGNNNIITENQIKNNACEKPFEIWNNKQDKIQY